MLIDVPVNFGRCRGRIGRAGGESAIAGARDRGGGGRAPDPSARWRPWRRPHWPLPAVSPAPSRGGKCQFSPRRKGGESASSAPAGRGGKVPVQPPPEGGGKCQFLWRRSAAAGGFEAGRPGGSGDCRSWPGQKLRRCLESGPIRPSASFSSRCRVFQRASMLRLPARLRRFLRLRGWPGIRARWAYATPARCARPTVLWVRVSHEIAVPVGHDRPPVAGRHDVRSAAIWAAPLRVPLLKDPADNHIRLVQLAGGWAGSPSVGNLANIHLPIVVYSGDGAAAVGSVLTGNRDG